MSDGEFRIADLSLAISGDGSRAAADPGDGLSIDLAYIAPEQTGRMNRPAHEGLLGDGPAAEELVAALLAQVRGHSPTRLELAAALRTELQLHHARGRFGAAAAVGLECLALFGVTLPAAPSPADVRVAADEIWELLAGCEIETVADLPLMTDPEMLVVAEVVNRLSLPVLQVGNLELYWLLGTFLTNLSLRFGNAGASVWGGCWLLVAGCFTKLHLLRRWSSQEYVVRRSGNQLDVPSNGGLTYTRNQ